MKLLVPLAAAFLMLPAAANAAPPAPPSSKVVPLDGVIAIVDDVVFFRSDVLSRLKKLDAKFSKVESERREQQAELVKRITKEMIDEALVVKDATKMHIEVSDSDVDRAVEMVAQQNQVDRKALENEVKEKGYTLAEYREELRRQILQEKWLVVRAASKIDRTKLTTPAELEIAFEKQREVLLADLRSHAFIEIR